jgi:imidazolonepropionase-like amidohydrolase
MQAIVKQIILSAAVIFTGTHSFAQSEGIPAPAPSQTKSILLKGGTLHVGNGVVIENAAVGFNQGKITLVADLSTNQVNDRDFAEVINTAGKHIYPGFIIPNSTLGLREIDAVRATRDFSETGQLNPNVRAVIAYNTESRIIPTVRNNGVLLAQVTPRYGLVSGTSSVVELDGWNWQDAAYRTDDGVHVNWPAMYSGSGWWAEPGSIEKNKETDKQINELRAFFADSKAYAEQIPATGKNLKLEAMSGLFNGTRNLYINADYVKDIIRAVNFAKEFGVANVVIVGANDAHLVAEFLKENNVSVILNRTHSLPGRDDDDVDLPYKIPFLMQQAGVLFCLNYEGDMEAMGSRNLAFTAGTAAAYGLTKEQALMSITLNAAKILGIDKTVGTVELGKDATLFVSSGDALDMRGNQVEAAFIRGKRLTLDDPQKQLYRKYSAKFEGK